MNRQEKVFRFGVCAECAHFHVCQFVNQGNDTLRKFIEFQDSSDGKKLKELSSKPFSIRLVCETFIPNTQN